MKAKIIIGVTSALALVGVVELCSAIEYVVGYRGQGTEEVVAGETTTVRNP